MLIDGNGLEKDCWDGERSVLEGLGGFEFAAMGESDGRIDGALGEGAEGLINGHGLRAANDADDRSQVSVLTGNEHLAGELVLGESLNSASGGIVVGGGDGGKFAVGFLKSREGGVVGVLVAPIPAPSLIDNGELVRIFGGFQGKAVALLDLVGIVVRRRALKKEVIATGSEAEQRGGLEFADLEVVEGNVKRNGGVFDEAVIADDGNVLLLRSTDDGSGLFGVVRHDDEHVDAGIEELEGLLKLVRVAALRVLNGDFGTAFLGAGLDQLGIALPTLELEVIEENADMNRRFLRVGSGGNDEQKDGNKQGGCNCAHSTLSRDFE